MYLLLDLPYVPSSDVVTSAPPSNSNSAVRMHVMVTPKQTAGFLCATWKRTSPNLEREIFLDPAQD